MVSQDTAEPRMLAVSTQKKKKNGFTWRRIDHVAIYLFIFQIRSHV